MINGYGYDSKENNSPQFNYKYLNEQKAKAYQSVK